MEKQKRRAIAAAWMIMTGMGDEQVRAFNRLARIAGVVAALDVWLSTKPDPVLADKVISSMLFSHSPLMPMTPKLIVRGV